MDKSERKLYSYQETVDMLNELCLAATSNGFSLTDSRKEEIWKAIHWALVGAIGTGKYTGEEASNAS